MPGVSDSFLRSYIEKRQTAWRLKMRSAHGKHASHFHACLLLLGRGLGGEEKRRRGREMNYVVQTDSVPTALIAWGNHHVREHKCDPRPLAKHQENLAMVLRHKNKIIISVSMYNYHSTLMAEFKYSKSDPWLPVWDANTWANRGNDATGRNR